MRQTEFKKALVTGGAGFIGSHIAERLLKLGCEVVVLDDLSMGMAENVPKGAAFIYGNILDSKAVKESLAGVDVVFHNAARVSIRNSFDDIHADAETNILGTVNLLKECGRSGIKKIIYASSMAVYAQDAPVPLKETGPLKPASPYGLSKLAGEMYIRQMAAYYGFDAVVLRYFNTYGARQSFTPYVGVITIFITNLLRGNPPVIYGTGMQMRDFIHVKDVAEANVLAMLKAPNGSTFNVGTGKGTTVADIAELLIQRMNPGIKPAYAPLPKGEPTDSIADIDEARAILGFEPKEELKDGIDDVIEWHRLLMANKTEE